MNRTLLVVVLALVISSACGGRTPTSPTPGGNPTPTSIITPTGNDRLVFHTFSLTVGGEKAGGPASVSDGFGLTLDPDNPGGLVDVRTSCSPDSSNVQGYVFLDENAWHVCIGSAPGTTSCGGYVSSEADACHGNVALSITREFVISRANFYVAFLNGRDGVVRRLVGDMGVKYAP